MRDALIQAFALLETMVPHDIAKLYTVIGELRVTDYVLHSGDPHM